MKHIKTILFILLALSFLIFAVLEDVGIIDQSQYQAWFWGPLNTLLMLIGVIGLIKGRKTNA